MNTIPITLVGNLVADPELRFTASGVAVTRVTIAQTPRKRVGDKWEDGEPTFMDGSIWRGLAENVAESLAKGARVIATGTLRTERWETKEGEKRSRVVCDISAIGPDLTYATATVKKMTRSNAGDPDDPWASATTSRPANPAPGSSLAPGPRFDESEPPF